MYHKNVASCHMNYLADSNQRVILSDTLKSTSTGTLKGTQSVQEQLDQLRLEFDELIQKLKDNKKTKNIFEEDV